MTDLPMVVEVKIETGAGGVRRFVETTRTRPGEGGSSAVEQVRCSRPIRIDETGEQAAADSPAFAEPRDCSKDENGSGMYFDVTTAAYPDGSSYLRIIWKPPVPHILRRKVNNPVVPKEREALRCRRQCHG